MRQPVINRKHSGSLLMVLNHLRGAQLEVIDTRWSVRFMAKHGYTYRDGVVRTVENFKKRIGIR